MRAGMMLVLGFLFCCHKCSSDWSAVWSVGHGGVLSQVLFLMACWSKLKDQLVCD